LYEKIWMADKDSVYTLYFADQAVIRFRCPSGRYLRITHEGRVDGNGGRWRDSRFVVIRQGDLVKFRSVCYPNRFLCISPNRSGHPLLLGLGHGGKFSVFNTEHQGNGVFSFISGANPKWRMAIYLHGSTWRHRKGGKDKKAFRHGKDSPLHGHKHEKNSPGKGVKREKGQHRMGVCTRFFVESYRADAINALKDNPPLENITQKLLSGKPLSEQEKMALDAAVTIVQSQESVITTQDDESPNIADSEDKEETCNADEEDNIGDASFPSASSPSSVVTVKGAVESCNIEQHLPDLLMKRIEEIIDKLALLEIAAVKIDKLENLHK